MERTKIAGFSGEHALDLSRVGRPEFVEVGLLLSSNRMDALMQHSKRTGLSVGQMVRGWIDAGLSSECPALGCDETR